MYVYDGQGIDDRQRRHGPGHPEHRDQPVDRRQHDDTPSLGAGIQLDHPGAGTLIRFDTDASHRQRPARLRRARAWTSVTTASWRAVSASCCRALTGLGHQRQPVDRQRLRYLRPERLDRQLHPRQRLPRTTAYGDCTDDSQRHQDVGHGQYLAARQGHDLHPPGGLCNFDLGGWRPGASAVRRAARSARPPARRAAQAARAASGRRCVSPATY